MPADTAEPMDEDSFLQQALAMSMQPDQAGVGDENMLEGADDDLQRALQMSMMEAQGDTAMGEVRAQKNICCLLCMTSRRNQPFTCSSIWQLVLLNE